MNQSDLTRPPFPGIQIRNSITEPGFYVGLPYPGCLLLAIKDTVYRTATYQIYDIPLVKVKGRHTRRTIPVIDTELEE